MSTLPKRAQFLLSDDLREETNGKMTIIGLYTDGKIYPAPRPPGAPPLPLNAVVFLPQLSIACIMFGGAGTFPTTAEIKSPSGLLVANYVASSQFIPGASATLALRGMNVSFTEFGKYSFAVTVGGKKTFSWSFEIVNGPSPALPSPAASQPIATASRRRQPKPKVP